MRRSEVKATKSGRKSFKDVTNNNVGRFSKSTNPKIAFPEPKDKKHNAKVEDEDKVLDRLLLVQSDLSCLIHQIDELVVQVFKSEALSKEGREEVDSFTSVLTDILSSLTPWIPRFRKVLATPLVERNRLPSQTLADKTVPPAKEVERKPVDTPKESKFDSLISPSPLVSWRANCTVDRGRQMFMLTPLPISKVLSHKYEEPSKDATLTVAFSNNGVMPPTSSSVSENAEDYLPHAVVIKLTPANPPISMATKADYKNNMSVSSPPPSMKESSMLVMTPGLKFSPPKSCVLLEPICESSILDDNKIRKSTPFPVATNRSPLPSSGSDVSEDLAQKYPELLGMHQLAKSGIRRKEVEESPCWFMSPLKTCVLLEPPNGKSLKGAANAVLKRQINVYGVDIPKDRSQICNLGKNLTFGVGTSMLNEPDSTCHTGKCPGENTLKKELWTKFEAASTTDELCFDDSLVSQTTKKKGFLDLLDEASCEGES